MLTCRQCRRANPEDAVYCWFDGVHLDSPHHRNDPVESTPRRFLHPLVLRSGVSIASFADLARLAGSQWEDLLVALRDGSLEKLFRRIKRDDLAQRAAWAAKHADPEQALDELLGRLPDVRREPAKLAVDPAIVDLGSISRTTPRTLTLRLTNRGQGLLQGTVRVEGAAWLSLDSSIGLQQKLFRCPRELAIPVRVVGKALRAGKQPLEGKIVIDSNGGVLEIPIRALVPVVPFGEGVLTGATSPGQLAEKAAQAPKEAAALFERGLVVAWYEANGWIYPVNGPIAEGLGAVQQFFEALGKAVPPKVVINETRIELRGAPGESVQGKVVLSTTERRAVYAHGVSQADWLEVGRASLDGPRATLPLRVRRVPDRPNERLTARVEVGTNGGKKFQVEVVLQVLAGVVGRQPAAETLDAGDWLFGNTPTSSPAEPVKKPQPVPRTPVVTPANPVPMPQSWLPAAPPAETPTPTPEPAPVHKATPRQAPPVQPVPEPETSDRNMWVLMLAPLLLLSLCLGGLFLHDIWLSDRVEDNPVEFTEGPLDDKRYIRIDFNDVRRNDDIGGLVAVNMTFGLTTLGQSAGMQLIYDEWGRTNNTCVQVDGRASIFGAARGGKWLSQSEELPAPAMDPNTGKPLETGDPYPGRRSVWLTPDGTTEIEQVVGLVRGDASRKLDTALVRYTLTNRDSRRHEVGLRIMLDTYIGKNDGVPFTIPGESKLCNTMKEFNPPAIPDYLEALENEDLGNTGTVAHLRLKLGNRVEAPTRVTLGAWPNDYLRNLNIAGANGPDTLWTVPLAAMNTLKVNQVLDKKKREIDPDSAVTLYWDPQSLDPGKSRVLAFTYGLGHVASQESKGQLALTVGGRKVKNGEFTLTALVAQPAPNETLTVELPKGIDIRSGSAKQDVPPVAADSARKISTLTWRLSASAAGKFPITVRSSRGTVQTTEVLIRTQGVFD